MSLQFLLKSQESEKIEINYLKVFWFFFGGQYFKIV